MACTELSRCAEGAARTPGLPTARGEAVAKQSCQARESLQADPDASDGERGRGLGGQLANQCEHVG
eukprot:9053740-Alexandrium_andersonii.AAC.1